MPAPNDQNIFLGFSPRITVEPYYESGEFDINILPLVVQKSITNKFNFRATSILNYGFREDGNNITHFGVELGFPFFFYKQLYVSPIISITRNNSESHTNIVNAIEPGYHFRFENNFSLFTGIQFGNTYFIYDDIENEWKSHFGINIILGKWF